MDNLEKQIQDFWENQTTPEQRREILRQLETSGMEWKDFLLQYYNKVLAGQEPSGLAAEQKSRVWQKLQEQHLSNTATTAEITPAAPTPAANTQATRLRRIPWLSWVAAAAIAALFAALYLYQPKHPATTESIAIAPPPATTPKTIITTNTTTTEQHLTLPDNSLVALAPGSSIRYRVTFESTARNIQLEGRALFDVAKDSARPFTVTAHGFATTALGTRFIIDATKPVVSIRLLKGKVVINATAGAGFPLNKIYLQPGDELTINTLTKHFDHATANSKATNKPAAAKPTTTLSFERTNLATVFQRLSEYYKTPILYDKAQIQTLSFTGEFNSSDELDLALKVICNMNQLSFTKDNGRIIISKQQ